MSNKRIEIPEVNSKYLLLEVQVYVGSKDEMLFTRGTKSIGLACFCPNNPIVGNKLLVHDRSFVKQEQRDYDETLTYWLDAISVFEWSTPSSSFPIKRKGQFSHFSVKKKEKRAKKAPSHPSAPILARGA